MRVSYINYGRPTDGIWVFGQGEEVICGVPTWAWAVIIP